MKNWLKRTLAVAFCSTAFFAAISGQQPEARSKKALRIAGKSAVVVLKTTTKVSWELVRLAGKHVIAPAAKNIVVPVAKATPRVAKAGVKLAGKGIMNGAKRISELLHRDSDDDPENGSGRLDATGVHFVDKR